MSGSQPIARGRLYIWLIIVVWDLTFYKQTSLNSVCTRFGEFYGTLKMSFLGHFRSGSANLEKSCLVAYRLDVKNKLILNSDFTWMYGKVNFACAKWPRCQGSGRKKSQS